MKGYRAVVIFFTLSMVSVSLCNKPICDDNRDCLSNHNCINGSCVHRGYFPPNKSQLSEIIFMCVLSTVATSAGVGGGPIYSALLMFIDNFEPQIAFPISSFTILICSIITFALGVKQKLNNPSMLFIDYDLAVVFCPALLLGTRIGVIFNSTFPDLVLVISLIVFLSFSSFKTYKNALKARSKERQFEGNQIRSNPTNNLNHNSSPFIDNNNNENDSEMIIELIRVERDSNLSETKGNQIQNYNIIDFYNDSPNLFHGTNAPININRVKWVILLQIVMVLDQLLEGNNKINSIINIRKCSISFWFIFCCFIAFCLIFTRAIYSQIKSEDALFGNPNSKKTKATQPTDGFKITSAEGEAKINKIVFFCFLAGVFSGMLGIGGGLFMTPLMLELNVNTQIATSTSNFFLIFTSFSSTCLYMLGGNLILSYAVMFGFFCGVFAYIGSSILSQFIERTHKSSVLIWILLWVSILSLILLPINAITHAMYALKNGKNIFGLKHYC